MWSLGLAVLVAAGVIALASADWLRLRRIPQIDTAAQPNATPLVSLLIPARNEERVIERAVRAALAQNYAPLEVIVLNDSSTDRTGQVLAQLQGEFPQLRVLQGTPLPQGWVGKPHACLQLSAAAHGTWLLFLDADAAAAPQLTTALLAHAEKHTADMVTVFPFQQLGTWAERLILPTFFALITALYPIRRQMAADARPDEVMANGQCIFVRRSAYDAIGGHAAVADQVLEDVHLAQALRRNGARIAGAAGLTLLTVRMYTSADEVISGLKKHAAAGFRNLGNRRALKGMARQIFTAWAPLWLLGFAVQQVSTGNAVPALLIGAVAQAAMLLLWGRLYTKLYRLPAWHALFWPFGLLGYFLIALAGIIDVWRGRGVEWRGRRYNG